MTRKPPQHTLEGPTVTLRPLGADDAEAMHEIFRSPTVRAMTGSHGDVPFETVRAWYAGLDGLSDRVDYGIVVNEGGELIGEAVLNRLDPDNHSATFRILLDADRHAGRGYGTEATLLLVEYGFVHLGLNRIELGVYAFNERARRVYERVGFVVEGVRREALWWEGRAHDEIIMAMLRRDFERRGQLD
jgi:RimJ/RimL family protein N-acetyltransferase